jgi:hypothetical protein
MEGVVRKSATINMLSDKERFILAKRESLLNILIELIQSNDGNNRATLYFDSSARMSRKILQMMNQDMFKDS